jgi:predicted DNA-binding transcriptional regulator YafY
MSAPNADPLPETDAQRVSVHVRFAPSQGRRLRRPEPFPCGEDQSLWVERPVLMERADGTYDLIGTTARPDALARWILSHGAAATVAGPERLRERVAAEARRVWERHTDE